MGFEIRGWVNKIETLKPSYPLTLKLEFINSYPETRLSNSLEFFL